MKRFLCFFFLLLAVNCKLFASPALAKDFSSYYKTTYEFNSSGKGLIQHEVTLINETPDLYVSEYTLSLNGTKIENIEAFDKIGPLKISKSIKDETTLITLSFNEKQAGKGKLLSFILKYQTSDLAQKRGNLWEISIPKIGNADQTEDYEVLLKVPLTFGNIAYINPQPLKREKDSQFHLITFEKNNLSSYGAQAVFGQWQTFDFELDYEINNDSSEAKLGKIAIPPDTSYQDIFYDFLNPLPENVELDQDGNWLAVYQVEPKQTLKIKAKGYANLFLTPKKDFPKQTEILNEYLKEDKYWEINDQKIKDLAQKLQTPESIYRFVVKTLKYDENLISPNVLRKGAISSLDSPNQSLCSEFTDLFIALCRASGIPARELEGFTLTDNNKINSLSGNSDLLHSWPEYYDLESGEWVMVDPTFESTTGGLNFFSNLDMGHFVFVTHGVKSNYPYPAGSYKESLSEKQVYVSFGKEIESNKEPQISVELFSSPKIYSLRKNEAKYQIINNSGFAVYKRNFIFDNNFFYPKEKYFSVLPPFSKNSFSVFVNPKETFSDYSLTAEIISNEIKLNVEHLVISSAIRLIIVFGIIISLTILVILKSLKKEKISLK